MLLFERYISRYTPPKIGLTPLDLFYIRHLKPHLTSPNHQISINLCAPEVLLQNIFKKRLIQQKLHVLVIDSFFLINILYDFDIIESNRVKVRHQMISYHSPDARQSIICKARISPWSFASPFGRYSLIALIAFLRILILTLLWRFFQLHPPSDPFFRNFDGRGRLVLIDLFLRGDGKHINLHPFFQKLLREFSPRIHKIMKGPSLLLLIENTSLKHSD